jgi:predicted Rossmann fold flavoprotein
MSNTKFSENIIIGAGAAGLFCGYKLGENNCDVIILEHNKKPARKIQISGGGRCNFTNTDATFKNFYSQNPHFCKSALARYSPWDMVSLVSEYGIEYVEKKPGQLFCKTTAKPFIEMLLNLCHKNNVSLRLSTQVRSVSKENDLFTIETQSETYQCKNLIVATGGLSIPNIGATDFGYQIAKQFNHEIVSTYPALVPFTISPNPFSELSGVSAYASVKIDHHIFNDDILFTHKGLSGPAILQISTHWSPGTAVTINLIPQLNVEEHLSTLKQNGDNSKIKKYFYPHLSKRIVDKFMDYFQIEDLNLQNCSQEFISKIANLFNRWNYLPSGTEGFRKAEVTVGGISTEQISSKTMESTLCNHLFFIGEVVDVTGQLGGYNFQWAWASAHACAEFISNS